MRNSFFMLFIALAILASACSNEENNQELILESCALIANSKIISTQARDTTCSFRDVYRYQSNIYITCICCVCNKISNATNCDTIPLCDISQGTDSLSSCMEDFYEEADYLFSVEEL